MIIAIKGAVSKLTQNTIELEAGNLTYEIFASKNTIGTLNTNDEIKISIIQIFKEDSQNMYGFLDVNEKHIFSKVIKISGVGPKIALEICSSFTPQSFYEMVQTHDIDSLKRVPGIGAKSAGKILVELGGFKLDILEDYDMGKPHYSEVLSALTNLGFSKKDILRALETVPKQENTQALIKEALKKLSKQ